MNTFEKLRRNYVPKNYIRITSESFIMISLGSYVIKLCKREQKDM